MAKVNPTGKAFIGQDVAVPDLGVIGEVAEISSDVKNLITQIKITTQDGIAFEEVEDLIVDGVYLVRKIRISTAFKLLFQAVKNLFSKNK